MIKIVYAAIMVVVAFVLGLLTCILIQRQKQKRDQGKIQDAEQEALRIVNEAIKNGESKKREALVEAKEEILRSRNEYEKEVKERRAEQQKQERRLQQKEENLDRKTDALESARRPSTRSMPLWTRKTKKSRSSSAARPKCSNVFPVLLPKTPRST